MYSAASCKSAIELISYQMKPIILLSTDYIKSGKKELHSCDSRYVNALCEAGALPLLCPSVMDEDILTDILETVHGVLFIGGDDYPPSLYGQDEHPFTQQLHPLRASSDIMLCKAVLKLPLPLFGICGGCQLLNIVCGGKLIQHVNDMNHEHQNVTHNVLLSDCGILHDIYGDEREIAVKSVHHQAVDPEHLGQGLRITARSPEGLVEAVEFENAERFILGVQWHPERYDSEHDRKKIFSAFVNAASKYKNS